MIGLFPDAILNKRITSVEGTAGGFRSDEVAAAPVGSSWAAAKAAAAQRPVKG